MVIAGAGDIHGDFLITPQQVRNDYVRSGAVPGGAGEGLWLGTTDEMIVDGSVAAVTYAYGPTAAEDWAIYEAIVGYYCGTGAGPAVWGTTGGGLNNGVLLQLNRTGLATTQTLVDLFVNTDMMKIGSWNHGDDGVTYWSLATMRFPSIGGLVLHGAQGDRLQVLIRDDLTAAGAGTTFWAYVRGYKMTSY